jgi:CYTH domain-containing protein
MEIERKFLLRALPPLPGAAEGVSIEQGYLAAEADGRQVRLRKKGAALFLAAKRPQGGFSRDEAEIELSPAQFGLLWPLTAGRRLAKRRFEIPLEGGVTAEVDVYEGSHRGLVVAEVEFTTEEEARAFNPPEWFAEEISDRPEYSNRNLARE